LRLPAADALAIFLRPRYVIEFDLALNFLAYAPLGALACLDLRATNTAGAAMAKAITGCAAFSLAMEACQLFVPFRVSSLYDVAANTAGAAAGTLIFADPLYSLVTKPLGEARKQLVIGGGWGDAGLVLVVLWLLAQLNPALPFFEAGNIGGEGAAVAAVFWVTAGSVALSVTGFGLFISVLLKGPGGALRWTLLLLSGALWLKFAAASVMLKPHVSPDWVTEGRVAGLVAGLAVFLPLRHARRPARIYLAIMFSLAGALFAKIFGAYSALAEFLWLFSWPYGQLTTFATLTRYLHESWPAFALAWLIALFIGRRHEALN
jgi:hypothetical protein